MNGFLFDTSQYFRFPMKELEEDYVKYLSGSLAHSEQVNQKKAERISLDSISKESDPERQTPRSRRNTNSSTGRRRKRTEGEDDAPIHGGDIIDMLAYDLAHHCKFAHTNEMESEYQMMLSGTLNELGSPSKTQTNQKNAKPSSQRSRDRSVKIGEKNTRRVTPTEEQKVSPSGDENEQEFRGGTRARGYRGRPRSHYTLTPYQGVRRCFGEFMCPRCYRVWASAYSRANTSQQCNSCGCFVYPHAQWPLSWFMPMPRPEMDGYWDDLEDQENRYMGRGSSEENYEFAKLGNGDRRPAYRQRYPLRPHRMSTALPLRPHYRRRREQEV